MFLTVVFVWIGLSVLSSLLVLAAVVRGGQMERMAAGKRDEPPLNAKLYSKKPHVSPTQTTGRDAPGGFGVPRQEWGVPVQASQYSSDRPSDKI